MRIVFMGTPEFAVPSLKILAANNYSPVAVVTGPDKRRGRGQRLSVTAVKAAAVELGIETILQPESVRSDQFISDVQDLKPDVIIVVAFRILPEAVFSAASIGSFNLHGSILPKYRGAAPIHHAVLNGDTSTGVTTFFLQEKVDTGQIILTRSLPIGKNDTTGDVHDRMMYLGAEAVLETVNRISDGNLVTTAQDDSLATPAPKVFRKQAQIDWSADAEVVHNRIRGFSPVPGAWTLFQDKNLKVLRSEILDNTEGLSLLPGHAVRDDAGRLVAGCGKGSIEILEMQLEGRRRMSAADFLNGFAMPDGYSFTSTTDGR